MEFGKSRPLTMKRVERLLINDCLVAGMRR